MNTNSEHAPAVIFDWIEKLSFSQLDAAQQAEVLNYFSKEEYDGIWKAASALRSLPGIGQQKINESRKKSLMDAFDKQHAEKKIIPLFSKSLIAWQAASLILFMLCGWLFYNLADLKKDSRKQQTAALDTVFVTKEIRSEPAILHDTVYLYRQAEKKRESSHRHSETNMMRQENEGIEENLYVLPLSESTNNEPRGTSMKDDSLLKRFTFVSL